MQQLCAQASPKRDKQRGRSVEERIYAIVNPASGRGRTGRQWPKLRRLITDRFGEFTWDLTRGPGHATLLTESAIHQGHRRLLSIGGDGTHYEVANGFIHAVGNEAQQARLALLPQGTGSDLAKTLDIPRDPIAALEILARDRAISMDVGRCRFLDQTGRLHWSAFLNVASVGMGGEVVRRVDRTTKALGGFLSFFWATLVTLLTYHPKRVRYRIDDQDWQECRIMLIAAANGQYFGGGMWVAPHAKLDDDKLEIIVVRKMTVGQLASQLGKIYRGTHLAHPKVSYRRAHRIEISSEERVCLDADGEPLGRLPVSIHLLHRAMRLVVGPGMPETRPQGSMLDL
jgi:diacylglycerol kinase (ATP)